MSSFFRPSLLAPARTPSNQDVNDHDYSSSRVLTGWIGNNCVKESSTTPGISCYVESAEVDDPRSSPVLGCCSYHARRIPLRLFNTPRPPIGIANCQLTFPAHLTPINVRSEHKSTEVRSRLTCEIKNTKHAVEF